MKLIKHYEKDLTATRAQKDTIINQIDSIREATSQQEQLKAEKIGMAQLKKQQKKLYVFNDFNISFKLFSR